MKSILTAFVLMLALNVAAQNIEITQTDITTLDNFDGNKVSFFGLKKGMTKAEAVKILNGLKQFTWHYDKWNTKSEDVNSKTETRIYVSLPQKTGEEERSVAYLKWNDGANGMSNLIIYADGAGYLAGDAKKLFTEEAVAGNLSYTKFLKGKAVVKEGDLTTDYTFAVQHFAFTVYKHSTTTLVWLNMSDY